MKRSKAHRRAQFWGKVRDYRTCQICGCTRNVEGHHILEYSLGGAAHQDNIVTLCHNCHLMVHSGKIDIELF